MQSGLSVSSAGQGPQGCKLGVVNQGATIEATFIFRFGVLLAADDGAHKLIPSLPIAPPSEIAAIGSVQPAG
jgi:hypothetical protein